MNYLNYIDSYVNILNNDCNRLENFPLNLILNVNLKLNIDLIVVLLQRYTNIGVITFSAIRPSTM